MFCLVDVPSLVSPNEDMGIAAKLAEVLLPFRIYKGDSFTDPNSVSGCILSFTEVADVNIGNPGC